MGQITVKYIIFYDVAIHISFSGFMSAQFTVLRHLDIKETGSKEFAREITNAPIYMYTYM